jgi:hypothetical protein
LLIVVGTLNLLLGLFSIFQGVQAAFLPIEQLERNVQQSQELLKPIFGEMPGGLPGAADLRAILVSSNIGLGTVQALAAFVTILGGVRMRQLRNHTLAVVGAVASAIPCVSCSACCGLGEVVGIWALVVLLNAEVRAAFEGIVPGGGGYGPGGYYPPGGQYPPPGGYYPPPQGGGSQPPGGSYYPPPGQPPQAPPQQPPGPPNEPPAPPAGS